MGGKMSVPYKVAEVFWPEMEKVELELAVANAKLAKVRDAVFKWDDENTDGCHCVNPHPINGVIQSGYVCNYHKGLDEALERTPTIRALDEEVEG
jgi:hypothetical protein